MKNVIYYLTLTLGIIFLNSCVKAETTSNDHNGRCTGSAYCSACSNCSRCAHCSAGGTCGVCAGSSRGRSFYSAPKKSKKTKQKKSTNSYGFYSSGNVAKSKKSNPVKTYYTNGEKMAVVATISEIANIRNAPSIKARIVEKVHKNERLIVIQNLGTWLKIKVEKTGTVGFVFHKNVR
ncbi:SH3 domain-containing protein [Halpernia humi]|uniref:SH3 domain-containing protein n=1 Tax=Halpernia humi TaxID=493375 RepID=A0A1H5SJK1_9FLAO|nr:SH3 domain-containing protein [Halpernia humi]SEF49991.1 SH3 domain-containing protein [Halpernia humi]